MVVRKKSRERPAKTDDSDKASVFEEMASPIPNASEVLGTPATVLEAPALAARSRASLGAKRMGETLDNKVSKRKLVRETAPETTLSNHFALLPKLDETITQDFPKREVVGPSKDITANDTSDYIFTIKPLMGPSFIVNLASDSSLFDLKDAIYAKIGISPEMQMLGISERDVNFDDEEQFLDDLSLSRQCTLHLSVRATTGIQVFNDIGLGEEEFFMYEFIPNGIDASSFSSNSSSSSETEEESEVEVTVTVPTASLPLPVLQSYLKHSVPDDNAMDGDKDVRASLHIEGLESLRISIPPEDREPIDVPSRPITPFPMGINVKIADEGVIRATEEVGPTTIEEKGPIRCHECGRRCRLAMQFLCRCGSRFCPEHRYFDKHNCPFDHKRHDRAKLSSANPRIYKPTLEQL